MKRTIYYILTFLTLSTLVIIIIDQLIMPYYIRHGKGKYMVNVVGKDFEYSDKILKSEGYKALFQIHSILADMSLERLLISIRLRTH